MRAPGVVQELAGQPQVKSIASTFDPTITKLKPEKPQLPLIADHMLWATCMSLW